MGRMRISLAVIAALCVSIAARAAQPRKVTDVWLDVDTATGIGDVDDGLMLIQSFHSPEVKIRGPLNRPLCSAPFAARIQWVVFPRSKMVVTPWAKNNSPVHPRQ